MYNDGFWGFPAVAAWEYKGSFWVKGDLNGNLSVTLQGNYSSKVYAKGFVHVASEADSWTQYNYTFQRHTMHLTQITPFTSPGMPLALMARLTLIY